MRHHQTSMASKIVAAKKLSKKMSRMVQDETDRSRLVLHLFHQPGCRLLALVAGDETTRIQEHDRHYHH